MEFFAVMRFKLTPGRLQTAAVHLGREWLRYAKSMGGKPEPKTMTVSWAGLEGTMDLVPVGHVEQPRGKVESPRQDSGASVSGNYAALGSVPDGAGAHSTEAAPKGHIVRREGAHVHPGDGREVRAAGGKGRGKAVS